MGRVERRRYRRRRLRAARLIYVLAAAVILAGLAGRLSGGGFDASLLPAPTTTPLAPEEDRTPVTREVTLNEECWYAIQSGVFTEQAAAEAVRNLYADRGARGFVTADGGRYRVFLACFADKTDAAAVRDRLSARQSVETYLYAWMSPGLTLRLTGTSGQLEVAEAGLALALNAAERLRDAAAALDNTGMTTEDVLALTDGLRAQADSWSEAAALRFDRPYPPLIAAEQQLADACRAGLDRVCAAKGDPTALSAALKSEAMALYAQVIAMRTAIADA